MRSLGLPIVPGSEYLADTPLKKATPTLDDLLEGLGGQTAEMARYGVEIMDHLADLIHETALLQLMAQYPPDPSCDRALLCRRGSMDRLLWAMFPDGGIDLPKIGGYEYTCAQNQHQDTIVFWEGPQALVLAQIEAGTRLDFTHENIALRQTWVLPMKSEDDPVIFTPTGEGNTEWLATVSPDERLPQTDLTTFQPVTRILKKAGNGIVEMDLRSGLMGRCDKPAQSYLPTFTLSQLPLPPELME